jgi:hypothetical protein
MHFVACTRPAGPLEEAPATSLRIAGEGEQIDGFWCEADGGYYARVAPQGAQEGEAAAMAGERWFRMVDDTMDDAAGTRIIPLPVRQERETRRPQMVLLGKLRAGGAQGSSILLGASRPRR